MQIYTATSLTDQRFVLGEGPCYHSGEWSWVDIKRGELWRMREGEAPFCLQTGQYIGAAIPTTGGHFIALMTTGAYLLDDTQILCKLGQPGDLAINQRFNDAKCDARGRLFAGTMALFGSNLSNRGSFYRMEADGSFTTVLRDTTISNGMAWTSDDKKLYYIDSLTHRVDVMDYDIETGKASGKRPAFTVDGTPDGMTIDEEGMLWVAIWDRGEVRRYNPLTGEILARVGGLSGNVSSCCFGGPDQKTLLITTSGESRPHDDMAGRIYTAALPIAGAATQLYRESDAKS